MPVYLFRLRSLPLPVRVGLLLALALAQAVGQWLYPNVIGVAAALIPAIAAPLLLPVRLGMPMGVAIGVVGGLPWHLQNIGQEPVLALLWSSICTALLVWLVSLSSAQQEFLDALEDASQDIIYLIDKKGRLAYINNVGAQRLGYTRLEMIGQPMTRFTPDWFSAAAVERLTANWHNNEPRENQIYALTRHGEVFTYMVRSRPYVQWGQRFAFQVARPAMTERLFEATFDSLPTPAVIHSPSGRVIACNQALAILANRTRAALVGEMLQTVIGGWLEAPEEWLAAAASGTPFRGEQVQKDGRTIAVTLYPIRDDSGNLLANISMVYDLTAGKEAEARMVQTAKLAAVGQLSAGVAHNINNLLTAISVSAELLQLDPAQFGQQAAQDILTAVDRGSVMVRKLYRLAGGSEAPRREPVGVAELIHGVLQLLRPQLAQRAITVEMHLQADLYVLGDANLLHQVFMNLALNSLQAMESNGRLTFSATAEESGVAIRVADTGCGIPAEHMERLFTPFFTTKGSSSGTGLGLSTSLTMVRAMGGHLHVESEVGQGTTFTVRLPDGTTASPSPSAHFQEGR